MKEGYVKQLRALLEAEVEQAESLIAARSFSQELQEMVEKLGRLVNEDLPSVSEQMRDAYGADIATSFEDVVGNTLSGVMDSLKDAKQDIDNSVSSIGEGGTPEAGADMDDYDGAEDDVDLDVDDADVDADVDVDLEGGDEDDFDDELGGDEAAAGPEDEPLGRAKKESVQRLKKKIIETRRKIAEAKKQQQKSKPVTGDTRAKNANKQKDKTTEESTGTKSASKKKTNKKKTNKKKTGNKKTTSKKSTNKK